MIYKDIELKDISMIKELWEKNRRYHECTSKYFSSDYSDLIFEERMAFLKEIDPNSIKITVAFSDEKAVGYCISIKSETESEAEMLSLHVDKKFRGKGIGRELSNDHIKWFKENECEHIKVVVSQENYNTIEFYKSLGFLPNTLSMKCKV